MSKLNTAILTLTLLLSIISTVYLYSATPAQGTAQALQPEAAKPAIGPGTFTGVDANNWYTTFEGVLATPNEAPLFPYFHGDVEISVSRFGENVNPFAVSAQLCAAGEIGCTVGQPIKGVGFQYMDSYGMAYDPIRNAQVDINRVVDGWALVLTYNKFSGTTGTNFRTIWAYAKFSDTVMAGSPADGNTPTNNCPNVIGGWILCPSNTPMPASPALTPHGGRKTNGFVQTALTPLVLVDSARRIVVASVNTIYDLNGETPTATSCGQSDTTCIALARLTLTFDFNKDTKELTIIKDVKLLLDTKDGNPITEPQCENLAPALAVIAGANYVPRFPETKGQGPGLACFELQDTEELDQAVSTATQVDGYAHFFDVVNGEQQPTTKCLTIPNGEYVGDPLYQWDFGRPNCVYDVMQAIDQVGPATQEQHVTSKAFWPVPDWFTVDAKDQSQFFSKLEGTTTTDLGTAPAVVGTSVQWNFILNGVKPTPTPGTFGTVGTAGADARLQWRSVETLLVTDLNTGFDCQEGGDGGSTATTTVSQINQISVAPDSITYSYTYSRTFYSTTSTPTSSHTYSVTGSITSTEFNSPGGQNVNPQHIDTITGTVTTPLQELLSSLLGTTSTSYYLTSTTTTGIYCTGSVIDKEEAYFDNMVFLPWDLNVAQDKDFSTHVDYFTAPGPLSASGPQDFGLNQYFETDVKFLNVPNDSPSCQGTQWAHKDGNKPCWDSYGSFAERVILVTQTGSSTALESTCTFTNNGGPLHNCNPAGPDTGKPDTGVLLTRSPDNTPNHGDYYVRGDTGPNGCTATTMYNSGNHCYYIVLSGKYGHGGSLEPAKGSIIKVISSCRRQDGDDCGYYPNEYDSSWEWIVVGRQSAAADSAGAAMVSENVYSNTEPAVAAAALDMADQTGVNPTIPFVLQRFVTPSGTADPVTDYQECTAAPTGTGSFLGPCPEGVRLHLRDDFSTIIPIDGSNIISVGGPFANQVTNLANDFLSVTFRPATGDLYAPGAWDSLSTTGTVFSPAQTECTPTSSGACTFPVVGMGVVSTYMDVDGTVYMVVWGGNAQDTFWTAQFLYSSDAGFAYFGTPAFAAGESGTPVYGCSDCQLFPGVTSVLLQIDYTSPHPPSITVFKELNTISEVFPEQDQ